jgi:hypothetical protein
VGAVDDMVAILTAESGTGGLGFSLDNTSELGGPAVYLSTNAAVGRVELKIRNDSTAPVSLTPDSRVTLAMAGVLSAEQAKAVRIEGNDWTIVAVDGTSITLSPNALTRLQEGVSTAVVLQSVLAAGVPRTRAVQIDYAKVVGAADDSRRLLLFVHNPPQFNTQLPLLANFDHRESYGGGGDPGDVVYTTLEDSPDVDNILKLALSSRNPQQPIPLLPESKPRVTVSCITGSDRGALCTDRQLDAVNCNPDQGDPSAPWTVEPQTENGVRTWILSPAARSDELFPASARIVSFVFDTLVTTLEAGDTLMYVQCTGVPKFDDGFVALKIQKMSPLKVTANAVDVGDATTFDWGPVAIAWDCYATPHSCGLIIDGAALDLSGKNPQAGMVTYTPPKRLDRPMRCTFVMDFPRVERRFDLIFRPVIGTFQPSATSLHGGEQLVLTWDCDGGKSCSLSGPGADASALGISDQRSFVVPDPIDPSTYTYELTCTGANGLSDTRRMDVSVLTYPPTIDKLDARWLAVHENEPDDHSLTALSLSAEYETTRATRIQLVFHGVTPTPDHVADALPLVPGVNGYEFRIPAHGARWPASAPYSHCTLTAFRGAISLQRTVPIEYGFGTFHRNTARRAP